MNRRIAGWVVAGALICVVSSNVGVINIGRAGAREPPDHLLREIQGLRASVDRMNAAIADLRAQNQELNARLQGLPQVMATLSPNEPRAPRLPAMEALPEALPELKPLSK